MNVYLYISLILIALNGCALLDTHELYSVGDDKVDELKIEGEWINSLPSVDKNRIGFLDRYVADFSEKLCNYQSVKHNELLTKNSKHFLSNIECTNYITSLLLDSNKGSSLPPNFSNYYLENLGKRLLIDSYDLFTCSEYQKRSTPVIIYESFDFIGSLYAIDLESAIFKVQDRRLFAIESDQELKNAVTVLVKTNSLIKQVKLFLPVIEKAADECLSNEQTYLIRNGKDLINRIEAENYWINTLSLRNIKGNGGNKENISKFAYYMCALQESQKSYIKHGDGVSKYLDKHECALYLIKVLDGFFKREGASHDEKAYTSFYSRLRDHLLIQLFHAYSCSNDDDYIPIAVLNAASSFWQIYSLDINYARNILNNSDLFSLEPDYKLFNAFMGLNSALAAIHSVHDLLPKIEDIAKECSSDDLANLLIFQASKASSSIDIDSFSQIRNSLLLEKSRVSPEAYKIEIEEILKSFADGIDPVKKKVNSIQELISKLESKKKTSKDLLSLNILLKDIGELFDSDYNQLDLLAKDQQRVHWKHLERITKLTNADGNLYSMILASRDNYLKSIDSNIGHNQCIANSLFIISQALDMLSSLKTSVSKNDRQVLIRMIKSVSDELTKKNCLAKIDFVRCGSIRKGSREYWRSLSKNIRKGMVSTVDDLENQSDGLTIDDWITDRNIFTPVWFTGIRFEVNALKNNSACY